VISVEDLLNGVYLLRNHPNGDWGDDYNALCIIQNIGGKYHIKGLIGDLKIDKQLIARVKEHFGTDRLYYERNTDLTKTKVI